MPVKKVHNRPKNIQALYYLLIFVAAGMMLREKSKPDDQVRLWWMLLWFALMLFVFFKATKNWARDNPKPSMDEILKEAGEKDRAEQQRRNMPDLSQWIKKIDKHPDA